jgi:stage V sporulation protein R
MPEPTVNAPPQPAPLPPRPETDLLWFIAQYAPDLEDWERDIFMAVREEAYYFHPIFSCQIMNEGLASYWHDRRLEVGEFEKIDAALTSSGNPFAAVAFELAIETS